MKNKKGVKWVMKRDIIQCIRMEGSHLSHIFKDLEDLELIKRKNSRPQKVSLTQLGVKTILIIHQIFQMG